MLQDMHTVAQIGMRHAKRTRNSFATDLLARMFQRKDLNHSEMLNQIAQKDKCIPSVQIGKDLLDNTRHKTGQDLHTGGDCAVRSCVRSYADMWLQKNKCQFAC